MADKGSWRVPLTSSCESSESPTWSLPMDLCSEVLDFFDPFDFPDRPDLPDLPDLPDFLEPEWSLLAPLPDRILPRGGNSALSQAPGPEAGTRRSSGSRAEPARSGGAHVEGYHGGLRYPLLVVGEVLQQRQELGPGEPEADGSREPAPSRAN